MEMHPIAIKVDAVTKVYRNHTVKAGVDIRRIRDDLLQGNNNAAAGSFTYAENQTSVPVGCASYPAVNGSCTGPANDVAPASENAVVEELLEPHDDEFVAALENSTGLPST